MGSSLPVEQGPGEFWDLPAKARAPQKAVFSGSYKAVQHGCWLPPAWGQLQGRLWAPSASSALSSSSLRVVNKLPVANLLLLKQLMALLQHIGHNAATSRMSCSNLAICVGPNLLSPPNEDLLPLQAMLAVTEKVRPTQQPVLPSRPIGAWLLRGPWLPPPLSQGWWAACLEEQPPAAAACADEGPAVGKAA